MKAVILAGGLGTRLSEETIHKPKPMVEVGGRPILWHVMKIYSHYGVNDFIICAGYRGYLIKEYFANYFVHTSDVTFDLQSNQIEVHKKGAENWKVTVIDTGTNSMTGGRLKRVRDYLDDEPFFFTYGDGVGNVDIKASLNLHNSSNRKATMTAVQPPGRFGALHIEGDKMTHFKKNQRETVLGLMVDFLFSNQALLITLNQTQQFGKDLHLENLAKEGELSVYKHNGFWCPMDTMRDKIMLNELWEKNKAPWKLWE